MFINLSKSLWGGRDSAFLCLYIRLYIIIFFILTLMKGYDVLLFETHFSAQRTVAQNIRSESDASFSASSKIAFIKK